MRPHAGLLPVRGAGVGGAGCDGAAGGCPRAAAGPSQRLAINLAGQPGVPSGVKGKANIEVPMAAPQTECGEPSAPSDVLGGAPGDLLRGTPPPAQAER